MMLCPPGVVWVVDLRAELTSHGPSQGDLHIIPQESPSQSTQRCGGCPRAVLPPPSATHQCNRWALCRDIFGFCHCSRSTPLIAMNYFGINGDVLRTSTINEASRMSAPANISWWREMGKYMVVEEKGWEHIEGGEMCGREHGLHVGVTAWGCDGGSGVWSVQLQPYTCANGMGKEWETVGFPRCKLSTASCRCSGVWEWGGEMGCGDGGTAPCPHFGAPEHFSWHCAVLGCVPPSPIFPTGMREIPAQLCCQHLRSLWELLPVHEAEGTGGSCRDPSATGSTGGGSAVNPSESSPPWGDGMHSIPQTAGRGWQGGVCSPPTAHWGGGGGGSAGRLLG